MLEPSQRVVMISGANRGIGLAIAQQLSATGYRLSVAMRDVKRFDSARLGLQAEVLVCRYEATDPAAAASWTDQTIARFGRVDALVNNAGMLRPFSIEEGDEALLDEMWSVNVKGPLRLIRAVLPHLKATGTGRVINIASLSGKRVANMAPGYAMTKFALVALTHAVRISGWEAGVRATAVCPSFVNTDFTREVKVIEPKDMTQPEQIAEMVALLLRLPNNASVAEILINSRLEPAW